jgi:type I restriction enzyme S subunit
MNYTPSPHINPDKVFLINRSELEGRLDSTSYRPSFSFSSEKFRIEKLAKVAYINPKVSFEKLSKESEVSFVPMECINEFNGRISEFRFKKVEESKGFTRFAENDLIWAKITPCMQNGKSAIARYLKQGVGCGSTEFFVIRPKSSDELLVDYIHFLLRDKRVLSDAQNYFGGSAGQQRVSSEFLRNFKIPIPPIDVQRKIVGVINDAYTSKLQKEAEAKALLDSIDDYLLGELGITLPKVDNSLANRIFTTRFSDLAGGRFDSNYYSEINRTAIQAILKSIYHQEEIKKHCKFIAGYAFSSDHYVDNSDCILVTIKNISQNSVNLDNTTFLPSDFYEKFSRFKINKHDLLIAMTGATIGKVGIFEGDSKALLNQRNGIIKSDRLNTNYLMSLLNTTIYQSIILRNSVGGAQPNISENDITRIKVPVPPLEKQNEIAEYIQGIRSQAKALQLEAAQALETAKQQVEKMILGE